MIVKEKSVVFCEEWMGMNYSKKILQIVLFVMSKIIEGISYGYSSAKE